MSNKTPFNKTIKFEIDEECKALTKAKTKFEAQKNVCVFIPATNNAQGYTIICDETTAQTKYKDFKQYPINQKE